MDHIIQKEYTMRGWIAAAGQVILWGAIAAGSVAIGIRTAHSLNTAPQQYRVTLYSGGKAVRTWTCADKPFGATANGVDIKDTRIIGGAVVIEPEPKSPVEKDLQ